MTTPESNAVTIHIGMPKSASTFLQEHLWKRCDALISCIPTDINNANEEPGCEKKVAMVLHGLMRLEENQFKSRRNEFKELVNAFMDRPGPKVISNEGFASANYDPFGWHSRIVIASRLKDLFPDAKILMIARNQWDFLISWFIQMRNTGQNFARVRTLKDMFEYETHLETLGISSLWGLCDYDELYQAYADIFGANSLHVLAYEMLREDGEAFVSQVTKIVGLTDGDASMGKSDPTVSENARHTWSSIWVRSLGRRMPLLSGMLPEQVKQSVTRISGLAGKAQPRLSEQHMEFITERYTESNRRFSNLSGLDLKRFKYPGFSA